MNIYLIVDKSTKSKWGGYSKGQLSKYNSKLLFVILFEIRYNVIIALKEQNQESAFWQLTVLIEWCSFTIPLFT